MRARFHRVAVLVGQQDEVAGIVDPGGAARVGEEHERQEPGHLGLVGQELAQQAG